LKSGATLEADIIVTATGLNLVTLGEIEFKVDGNEVDFAQTWTYKGLALFGCTKLGVDIRIHQCVMDSARRCGG